SQRSPLEPQSDLYLRIAHGLRSVGRTETRGPRRRSRRIDRAIRQGLRVADGQVRRAVVLDLRLPSGDYHRLQRVELVEAKLQALPAANSNLAHQREVDRLVRAAPKDVSTRLHTKAAVGRPDDRGRVELGILVVCAAAPWIADVHDPRPVVWRAR